MVAWVDYKAAARERGALALELYVVESTPVEPERLKDILPAHLAYQAEQEAAGTLAFAGPLSDESGEQMEGRGLIVYRAASLEAARLLVTRMVETGLASLDARDSKGCFDLRDVP